MSRPGIQSRGLTLQEAREQLPMDPVQVMHIEHSFAYAKGGADKYLKSGVTRT